VAFSNRNPRGDDKATLVCIYLVVIFMLLGFAPSMSIFFDSELVLGTLVITGILFTAIYFCVGSIRSEESDDDEFAESMDWHEIYPPYDVDAEDLTEDLTQIETKPIPGVAETIAKVSSTLDTNDSDVKVLRGGEFVGNRMRLKVKVLNDSPYLIADVTVYILTYPHDALKYSGDEHHVFFSKIAPGGFRSPTFDFLPTQDCVKGAIVAGVSYIDMKGDPHTLTAKPFVIRSVCDLLLPQRVTPQDFALKLKEHECGEIVVKIEEWTPEEMFDKALTIVDESNFFEVSSKMEEIDGTVYAQIIGFAQGKYTGKEVGVEIHISGPTKEKGASCTIRVSGEDQAMILPAIDDLKERLSAWLCPLCSSPLTLDNVAALREGKVIECPFCSVSIGR